MAGASGSGDGWKPEGAAQITDFVNGYPTIKCKGTEYWFKLNNLRRATPAEIKAVEKAEEERKQAEVSELQEGDTCDAMGEDIFAELHKMGLPLWTKHTVIWQCAARPFWNGKTIYHIDPDNLVKEYHRKLSVLPRKVFLRRAKGTAAKLAQEAKAKELAKPIVFGTVTCRASVLWFAGEMEKTLRDNDGKGGWGQCGHRWLFERLRQEVDELESAMATADNQAEVIKEASDVANFAMMIADLAGPLHGR